VGPHQDLLDVEYQYHRVGNRKATAEELQEMQQREEQHISQLQAEIELMQQRERDLATERQAREDSLRLLAKDAETIRRELEALRGDVETALAARAAFEEQVQAVTKEREELETRKKQLEETVVKARAEISALMEVIGKAEVMTAPEKERLCELLRILKETLEKKK
jgi:chromosome segregation ATPase